MKSNEIRLAFAKLWGHFMRERQFASALTTSILLHSEGHRLGDPQLTSEAVQMLKSTVRDFSSEKETSIADRECSFCGLKPPAVKLAVGRSGFICNSCVNLLQNAFEEEEKPPLV
jgi:hypothetical protein